MKTVNLSIPDDVWREARVEAAKRNTSLSALVRAYLVDVARGKAPVFVSDTEEEIDKRSREALATALQSAELVLGFDPSRDKTYDR